MEPRRTAEVVALCVPYSNHDRIIEEIAPVMAGKILVDAVVPLVPPKGIGGSFAARGFTGIGGSTQAWGRSTRRRSVS